MVGMHIALPPNIFFQIYFSFERTSGVENANLILYDDDMKNGLNNYSYPYMAVPLMTIMVGTFKCRCQLPYNMTAATWEWLPIVFRLTVNASRPSLSPSTSPSTSPLTSLSQLPIAFFLSMPQGHQNHHHLLPVAFGLLSFTWLSMCQSHHHQHQHHNRLNSCFSYSFQKLYAY